MEVFLDIALPVPIRTTFTYRYEAGAQYQPQIGARVIAPFGARNLVGIIINMSTESDYDVDKIKALSEVIDQQAIIPEDLLTLCRWASDYYKHPLGEVIFAAMPQRYRDGKSRAHASGFRHTDAGKGLPANALGRAQKQQKIHAYLLQHPTIDAAQMEEIGASMSAANALIKKGLIEKVAIDHAVPVTKDNLDILKEATKVLNSEQQQALDHIRYHNYACYLIEGTTGSGKTELYLQAVGRVLQSHRQALVLIPEIGLAAQTIARFKNRFNVRIAELHSNIAEAERAKSWHAAANGEARIVIGTRLASLTPFKDLGIIIIDEEHDASYKQQDGFKYSARDLSVYRAHFHHIPIVLGSATPSLESMLNSEHKRYQKLVLKKRAASATPPEILSVDLRNQDTRAGLSQVAIDHLIDTLKRGEQALIFINRRGFAPSLICHHCGWTADCDFCDTRMTVHKHPHHLRCHTCDRTRKVPTRCVKCSSNKLVTAGFGTEQLESSLALLVPDTPIIRIDRDSTRRKNAMQEKLAESQRYGACIFVGTQMLAKGHHLPNLTLVIVVDADQGLLGTDFRSLEHMGQLITQVAGRAGRAEKAGKVLVQTHKPDHPLLGQLLSEGYSDFANTLLTLRRDARLPPYSHCAIFRSESKRAENSALFLNQVKEIVARSSQADTGIRMIGPSPSSVERVNERYRYILQIFCPSRARLKACLQNSLSDIDRLASGKRTRWSLDIDPISNV